jgi:hypothetical protein
MNLSWDLPWWVKKHFPHQHLKFHGMAHQTLPKLLTVDPWLDCHVKG